MNTKKTKPLQKSITTVSPSVTPATQDISSIVLGSVVKVFFAFISNVFLSMLTPFSTLDTKTSTIKRPTNKKPSRPMTKTPTPPQPATIDHNQAGTHDFLKNHPDILHAYKDILTIYSYVVNSEVRVLQKARADVFLGLAEKTIDVLRALHNVRGVSVESITSATSKLDEARDGLDGILGDYKDMINNQLNAIELPKTYEQQNELEALRLEGERILLKMADDTGFDSSEDKFRLNKIINERLDALWSDYLSAKEAYYKEPDRDLLIAHKSTNQDPDDLLNQAFVNIRIIYDTVEMGIKSVKKEAAMSELLANTNYFENR